VLCCAVPDYECPICLDAFDTPVMTTCTHWFCKECILGVREAAAAAELHLAEIPPSFQPSCM
jgi:hypothetical protein